MKLPLEKWWWTALLLQNSSEALKYNSKVRRRNFEVRQEDSNIFDRNRLTDPRHGKAKMSSKNSQKKGSKKKSKRKSMKETNGKAGAKSKLEKSPSIGPTTASPSSKSSRIISINPTSAPTELASALPSAQSTMGRSESPTVSCFRGRAEGDAFGEITFFNRGNALPAGTYWVQHTGGCFKFGGSQDWTVHAYNSASYEWRLVGSSQGQKVARLPGTTGIRDGGGAFNEFASCVEANLALGPVEFVLEQDSPLGIFLLDSFDYSDNVQGIDGENPSWEVTSCLPSSGP